MLMVVQCLDSQVWGRRWMSWSASDAELGVAGAGFISSSLLPSSSTFAEAADAAAAPSSAGGWLCRHTHQAAPIKSGTMRRKSHRSGYASPAILSTG